MTTKKSATDLYKPIFQKNSRLYYVILKYVTITA